MYGKIDYRNTKLYKIETTDGTLIYVDYTTNPYVKKSYIKRSWNTNPLPLYEAIRNHGGWDNITFHIITRVTCRDSLDASIQVEQYINKNKLTPVIGYR